MEKSNKGELIILDSEVFVLNEEGQQIRVEKKSYFIGPKTGKIYVTFSFKATCASIGQLVSFTLKNNEATNLSKITTNV